MTATVRVRQRPTPFNQSLPVNPGTLPGAGFSRRIGIVYQPADALTRAPRQIRRHDRKQVDAIKANIQRFGCVVPVIATGSGEIVDGHLRAEACRELGIEVPMAVVDGLSEAEIKALRLSINKLAEQSQWDPDALAAELEDVLRLDPDLIAYTCFSMPEVDNLLAQLNLDPDGSGSDEAPEEKLSETPVSGPGDCWLFAGGHKLLCGNAREPASYRVLLGDEQVQMVASDPPYGCAIAGHVSRSHGEFVEGSGMNEAETLAFFEAFLAPMVPHLVDGAIAQLFIDWRGMHPLVTALRSAGLVQKALCVWDKGVGGMGSLYRQQAEFVVVAKWGRAPHINNVELGRHGRNRTTVWQAPGLAQFGKGRKQALAMHPTVKPVGLVADALLDTSQVGGIVLDPFCGSGTTLLAAHQTRRIGRGLEVDPRYVDVAVRRLERLTGVPARLEGSDRTFADVAAERLAAAPDDGADDPVGLVADAA